MKVPEALIGYPFYDRHIGIFQGIVNPVSKRWALDHEPHRNLFYFDPEYIHQWILGLSQEIDEGATRFHGFPLTRTIPALLGKMPEKDNKTLSLRIDMRSVATPTEPAYLN